MKTIQKVRSFHCTGAFRIVINYCYAKRQGINLGMLTTGGEREKGEPMGFHHDFLAIRAGKFSQEKFNGVGMDRWARPSECEGKTQHL